MKADYYEMFVHEALCLVGKEKEARFRELCESYGVDWKLEADQ